MNSSKTNKKTVIVKLSRESVVEIDVDTDIFDDPFVEAATQAIEECKRQKYGVVEAIMVCWFKDDEKSKQCKKRQINAYWVFINAGMYKKAEILRQKFLAQTDIDLSKEPLSSNAKQRQ